MRVLNLSIITTLLIGSLNLISVRAHAEEGLVEVCLAGDAYSTTYGNLCPERAWERPADGKAVLSCGTDPTQCFWGNEALRYRLWEDIANDELVLTCASDVPIGPFSVDPCGSNDSVKPRLPKTQVFGVIIGYGRAPLEWVVPVVRVDDTPFPAEEIGKFVVGYGTSSGQYDKTVEIDPALTSTVIDVELTRTTTYYFAIRVVDTDDISSAWSNEVQRTYRFPPRSPGLELIAEINCEDQKLGCVISVRERT